MHNRIDQATAADRPDAAKPENGARPQSVAAPEPLLVDLTAAAALLSLSRRTLKRMVAVGELPGVRRVRGRVLVVLAELREWIGRGCPPGKRGRR